MRSGLWLTGFLIFKIFWYRLAAVFGIFVTWPNFCKTENLTFHSEKKKSRLTQLLHGVRILQLQNKPRSSPLHHGAWQLVWSVCADVWCLDVTGNAGVHFRQTTFFVPICLTCSHFSVESEMQSLSFSQFLGPLQAWPQGNFAGTSSTGKDRQLSSCFSLVYDHSLCRVLPRMVGGNTCFMSSLLGIMLTHTCVL